ncbi:MAG: flagellin [Planctomycetes bacterium]|nr:flagellin [Planctomycetota bacterium]
MALGISNGFNGSLGIIRSLNRNQGALSRIFEQQSTGLRINRASDDPGGFVISEQLRAQIGSLGAAINNTSRNQSFVDTAEAGLSQVSDQLINLRSLAVQAAGAQTDGERQALGAAADATLGSINRIASTTRFGSQNLLNGSSSIRTSTSTGTAENVDIDTANFGTSASTDLNVTVNATATNAQLSETFTDQTDASTVRITGSSGSQVIDIGAGATADDIAAQINAESDTTGVTATVNAGNVELSSDEVGSDASVTLEVLSGSFVASSAGTSFSATGTDANVTVNGTTAAASGNEVTINSNGVTGSFEIDENATAGSTDTIRVQSSGQRAQLNTGSGDNFSYSVDSADTTSLGLSGIDIANDPLGALEQIDAAIAKVSTQRSELGALSQQTFEPNIQNLQSQLTNLSATNSSIRDLDFASSIVEGQKNQVLLQSSISVLAQQNSITAGGLFRLLGA